MTLYATICRTPSCNIRSQIARAQQLLFAQNVISANYTARPILPLNDVPGVLEEIIYADRKDTIMSFSLMPSCTHMMESFDRFFLCPALC